MSIQTSAINVQKFLGEHVQSVFETMLSMKAVPVSINLSPHYPERVTGSVGLGGENVTGAIYLHMTAAFARLAASSLLGLPPEELTNESEINDVIGELTNMVAGGFKSHLNDHDLPCAISTPAIIRGTAYEIEPPQGVQRESVLFNCANECITVEVHLRIN